MSIRKGVSCGISFVTSLMLLAGCGGSSSSSSSPGTPMGLASGGATYTYALQTYNSGAATVVQFTAGANGAVNPTGTLTPGSIEAESLAVDSSGQIYVNGYNGFSYVTAVYSGISASAPTRTIYTQDADSIAVDGTGQLYILTNGSIYVYSATATGNATPVRTITSTTSYLSTGIPVAMDVSSSGTIYVAASNTAETAGNLIVIPSGASGNVVPSLTIGLSAVPLGIAVDSAGDIFTSLNTLSTLSSASIVEYAAGSTTVKKTITPIVTIASEIAGVRVDSANNVYAVMDTAVGTVSNLSDSFSIVALGPALTGSVNPTDQMYSSILSEPGLEMAIK